MVHLTLAVAGARSEVAQANIFRHHAVQLCQGFSGRCVHLCSACVQVTLAWPTKSPIDLFLPALCLHMLRVYAAATSWQEFKCSTGH